MASDAPNKLKNLLPAHEIVALLVARGCNNSEIAEATGYNASYVWRIRNEVPGFPALVSEFKRDIQERVIEDTVDAVTRLNNKVPVMLDNLEELALREPRAGVRLRATQDWLDRAPDSPKRIQRAEVSEERTIIFGMTQVQNMKAALSDVGADEVVDLLEGTDYEKLPMLNAPDQVVDADEL
jgi:hypothetical protein